MRAPLAAFLVALVLPGCVFNHCGPSSEASWVEPGLFDALVARGAEPSGLPDGLPFDVALLNASWGDVRLHTVEGAPWVTQQTEDRFHEDRGAVRPSLVVPGAETRGTGERPWDDAGRPVVLVQGLDESRETLRAATEPFLAALNVTRPDAWYDTLASQRWEWGRSVHPGGNETPHYQYWAALGATPDIDGLVADLGPENATRTDAVFIEDVRMTWPGGWRLSFHASVLHQELEAEPPLLLAVNSADGVKVDMPDRYDGNETGARAWIKDTMEAHGLGTPTFSRMEWSTAIC